MHRIPPPLEPGDRVRVVAPSGPFDPGRFQAGIEALRTFGLEPLYDDGLFSRAGYLAGGDERRRAELLAALTDGDARALWTARGGYGAARVLAGMEPERVAAAGKWLVGFSDTTAVHCLWARAGLCSLHAANIINLLDWSTAARDELMQVLHSGRQPRLEGRAPWGGAVARGVLLGGNLTVLASLCGTGMLPSFAGAVLLIEDVGERPYRLDRAFTQLRLAGALDGVRGFALGQLTGCIDPESFSERYDAEQVLLAEAERFGVPVLSGLPVGHESSSRAVLLGAEVVLDPTARTLAAA